VHYDGLLGGCFFFAGGEDRLAKLAYLLNIDADYARQRL